MRKSLRKTGRDSAGGLADSGAQDVNSLDDFKASLAKLIINLERTEIEKAASTDAPFSSRLMATGRLEKPHF